MSTLSAVGALSKTILVLVAMEVEEQAIVAKRPWSEVEFGARLGMTAKMHLHGKSSVAVVRTGVGTVNAGVALALFSEKYPVSEIILLGVGGGISSELKAGDTVLATSILQHDCFLSHETGHDLMTPGELFLSKASHERTSPQMKTDPVVSAKIERYLKVKPKRGLVLSGNEFVGSRQRKLQLSKLYPDALLVEMESVGIAQLASRMKIPFAVAKTVADEASPESRISDHYLSWIDASAKAAEQVITGILHDLGE